MALPEEKRYTFADILEWDDDVRVELINGVPCMMAPPLTVHQEISGELYGQLYNFLKGKKCRVYAAPFGVRLFGKKEDAPEKIDGYLEPDITVVCDRSKLDQYGCQGAPDLIIEILSPSTQRRDRLTKLNLYREAGVREYWIVDPERKFVQTMVLDEGSYPVAQVYTPADKVPVTVLEGCEIDLSAVFEEK